MAIDTDSRVVEDTETDAFFVFTDDQRFRYDPPSAPSTTSTDRQASDIDPLAAGPGDGTADHTDQKSGEKSEPDPDEHRSAGESTEE